MYSGLGAIIGTQIDIKHVGLHPQGEAYTVVKKDILMEYAEDPGRQCQRKDTYHLLGSIQEDFREVGNETEKVRFKEMKKR